ncbi:unnamed protein product, partial [Brenthis ino]
MVRTHQATLLSEACRLEDLFEEGRSHRRAPAAAALPIPETSRASCVPTTSKALSHRPRCVYCKQYGHAREDCNRLKEKASSVVTKAKKSLERSQITCFGCGTPGVIHAKCIKCSKTAANTAFHTVSAIGSKPVDPRSRPLLEVLVYGARGLVLVDAGAKHCIASESLKANLYKNNHKFVKVRTDLKFADGTVKNLAVDTAQVEVTVLDIVVSTLFIVLLGATDSLLGMNFTKDSFMVLDFNRNLWGLKGSLIHALEFEGPLDSFRVACSTVGLPHDEGTFLKPEERRELLDVLERNQDVIEPGGAPTTFAVHRIDTGDHAPDRVSPAKREVMKIQAFNLDVNYAPGKMNVIADTLSRPLEDPEIKKIIDDFEDDDPDAALRWTRRGYYMTQGVLYRADPEGEADEPLLVVPESQRAELMKELHDAPTAGHLGLERSLTKIKERYYFPHMRTFVAQYLKSCDICKQHKSTNLKPAGLLQTPTPQQRFEVLAMDLFGPLPAESQGEVKWRIEEQEDRQKAVEGQRRRPTARFT